MKETIITIPIPEGYEIDQENSTFECIKLKPIKQVKTREDIKHIAGYYIDVLSNIIKHPKVNTKNSHKNVALTEKHAKSMLAFAQISQLMPYYGGEITKEEWKTDKIKFIILVRDNKIALETYMGTYYYLSFHTKEQRDEFLKHNEQLIKDYFMID